MFFDEAAQKDWTLDIWFYGNKSFTPDKVKIMVLFM